MKPSNDHFNYRPWLAVAVTAAFFVPLTVFGGSALAKSAASASQYQYGGSSQYQYKGKVTICHFTHSKKHPWVQVSIGAPAAKAHLRHHDTLGLCPTTPPDSRDKQHGKSDDKGTSNDQGDDDSSDSGDHGQSGDHGNSGDHGSSGDHGKTGDHGNGKGHGK